MALDLKEKPWFANKPNNSGYTFTNSSGVGTLGSNTNMQTLFTAGGDGSIVDSISISSTDTSAKEFFIAILNGTTCRPLWAISIPAGSGNSAAVLPVDGLSSTVASSMPIDQNGKRFIRLMPGELLVAAPIATLTSAKSVIFTVVGADYEN